MPAAGAALLVCRVLPVVAMVAEAGALLDER
jgi:hypothetical protein